MQSIKDAAAEFLATKRVAVTGVSRAPKTHGANNVYKRLRERGYQVFAVNPNTGQIEGDRSYPDLASIPGGVQAVVIGTRPEIAEGTMRECAELGIKHVWMHRGPGAGSVSAAAASYGRAHGITVIDGGCPLMFGPTADTGHKIMRLVYVGKVPKQVLGTWTAHHEEKERDVMTGTPPLDRVTASDLFLLMWDDYGWSTDIGGLAILDGASLLDPGGQVRTEAIRGQLEPRLHLVPRFRQLLYRPSLGRGWPLWVDAPTFDPADHIRVCPVAAPGGQAELLAACQELAERRLDPARPLWELWLLPGLPDRRVGAYLRLHHVLADGAAALAVFGALLDQAADAPAPAAPAWTPAPTPAPRDLLADNLRRRRTELGRGWSGLTHPDRTLRQARRACPAWREVLGERPAPHTSLNHPVGTGRRLAIVRGRLDVTKQIAHAHHATVNDVVLAAVAGGLRQLLASRGEDIRRLVQRAMVTISRHEERPGHARGNKPGWMMVPLPLGEPDPVHRLELIAAETAALKRKARPEAGTGIFRFAAGQRAWYRHFPRQRSVNLVVSNVAGPPLPLYLAGAPLLELFPMMPVMGNLTLVVAVLSYAGQFNLTATADRDACPDVEVFAEGVRNSLDDLARSAFVPTS